MIRRIRPEDGEREGLTRTETTGSCNEPEPVAVHEQVSGCRVISASSSMKADFTVVAFDMSTFAAAITTEKATRSTETSAFTAEKAAISDEKAELTTDKAEVRGEEAEITDGNAEITDGNAEITDGNAEITDEKAEITVERAEVARGFVVRWIEDQLRARLLLRAKRIGLAVVRPLRARRHVVPPMAPRHVPRR
jgi:hypothetical protein